MIWFVSDPHGGQDMDGLRRYLAQRQPGDLLMILGDMEIHFRDTDKNRAFTSWFEGLDCEIAFIDGNHENFDHLEFLPVEAWHGGYVHRVSPNIVHLMRGYVFEIEGSTFFTMGGCVSTQKWKDSGLWWPQENPSPDEIARGYENLRRYDNRVDYILTHKYRIEPCDDSLTLQGLTNYIEEHVEYKHWYSGHWHRTERPDAQHTFVYQDPIPLE